MCLNSFMPPIKDHDHLQRQIRSPSSSILSSRQRSRSSRTHSTALGCPPPRKMTQTTGRDARRLHPVACSQLIHNSKLVVVCFVSCPQQPRQDNAYPGRSHYTASRGPSIEQTQSCIAFAASQGEPSHASCTTKTLACRARRVVS